MTQRDDAQEFELWWADWVRPHVEHFDAATIQKAKASARQAWGLGVDITARGLNTVIDSIDDDSDVVTQTPSQE